MFGPVAATTSGAAMAADDQLPPKTRLFATMAPAIGTGPAAHLCNILEEWITAECRRNRVDAAAHIEQSMEMYLDGALVTIRPKGSPGDPPRQLPGTARGEEERDPVSDGLGDY